MTNPQTLMATETWIPAKWGEFLQIIEDPAYEKGKTYYYHNHIRLEMLPVGFDHSTGHSIIIVALNLFCILRNIPVTLADNCSYRKAGISECQPDISAYVGTKAKIIPQGTNIVNLNQYPPPDLVIEISKTTLLDDLGTKRSLYESLGVREYWIVDLENNQIIAYQMENKGSYLINSSQVLSDLDLSLLEEALRQSRQSDQSVVGRWLMTQFQPS